MKKKKISLCKFILKKHDANPVEQLVNITPETRNDISSQLIADSMTRVVNEYVSM